MDTEDYVDAYADIMASVADKDVALTILVEVAKDRRTAEINGGKAAKKATPKQLDYLENLGIKVRPGLTSAEASRQIDEAKARD